MIITPRDTAKLLKTNMNEVYRLLERGEIPAFKIGSTWKIPIGKLEEYVMTRAEEESRQRREMNNV